MAQDSSYDPTFGQQNDAPAPTQRTNKPTDDQWNQASTILNGYVNGSGNINWDAARSAFDQSAASGQGNFGDWVNSAYSGRDSWLTPKTAAPPSTPAAPKPFDREAYKNGWAGGDPAQLKAYNDQWGVTTKGDVSYLPTGEAMDMIINSGPGGSNQYGWTGLGSWSGDPSKGAASITPYTAPNSTTGFGASGGSGLTPPSTSGIGAPGSLAGTNLFNTLVGRSNQSLNVDPNDPIIKGQTDAYNANTTRANRQYLSGLAESQGPNANITAETRLASERGGQAGGAFQSTLMANELASRRSEIQSALTQQQGMLSQDQAAALQQELALIDDATRRLGINTQNSQFYSGLNSQNDQFAANYGLNASQQAFYQDAVSKGLI